MTTSPDAVATVRPLVDLAGLRLLVIGGGSGIGLSSVRLAHAAGARLAVADLPDILPAASAEPGVEAVAACDVRDGAAVEAAVAAAEAALGGLDAVISTAGVFEHRGLEETGEDDWARVIGINLDGPYHVARAALPRLVATKGSLVLFSSQIGLVGHRRATAYAASKAGVNGLTRTLAIEFADRGVRVNTVAPGPIETPMTSVARSDAPRAAALVAAVPLGRFGLADEVARAALFLAAPAAAYITGHVLVVDGGVTAV